MPLHSVYKKLYIRFRKQSLMIALLIVTLAGCGGAITFKSTWLDHPFDIRLKSGEIQNALTRIEDTQTMVAFLNDSNYLYISLVTSERSIQRQLLARGFVVWFDRNGGEDKKFGIKFPLGMTPGNFREMRELMSEERDGEDWTRGRPVRDSLMEQIPPFDTTSIEILHNDGATHERLTVMELKDIAVHLSIENGRLQYTLRVPLTDNGLQPYAIGTSPGQSIGIGLITSEMERPRMGAGEGPPGGMTRGGRGARGGFGGGGMPPGGRAFQQSEPLNIWGHVTLANEAVR